MQRHRTVAELETMSTKANTDFATWWDLLNAELAERSLAPADFDEAWGCYEIGECPETATAALQAAR